jgi:hypothetical protein
VAFFNRIIVLLLALAMLALAVALLATPETALSAAEDGLANLRAAPASSLLSGGTVLAALALVLLLLELRPAKARSSTFAARVEGGTVEYPAATIGDIVERDLLRVEGVRQATAAITGRGKVDVRARLLLAPDRDPQEVAAQASARLREKLERGLGLALGQVRLAIEPAEALQLAEEGRASPAIGARA